MKVSVSTSLSYISLLIEIYAILPSASKVNVSRTFVSISILERGLISILSEISLGFTPISNKAAAIRIVFGIVLEYLKEPQSVYSAV